MYETTLKLTDEEREILEGKKVDTLQKIMESVVKYGEVFEATEFLEYVKDDMDIQIEEDGTIYIL